MPLTTPPSPSPPGLIAAVGQGALSLGFSIGQIATGGFIEACQIGISLVVIKRCMLGLRAFAWLHLPLSELDSSFVATCLCAASSRGERAVAPNQAAGAAPAAAAAEGDAIAVADANAMALVVAVDPQPQLCNPRP